MTRRRTREYYKIRTSFANYYVEVWHQYPGIDKVYIGGRSKCMSMSIYHDTDEWPNIDGVGYKDDCNSRNNHVKGMGTVHLVKCGLRFVKEKYGTRRFLLKDTSYIDCSTGTIPLAPYYVTYHGKTWYESKFGATPSHMPAKELESQKRELRSFLQGHPDIAVFFNAGQRRLASLVQGEYDRCASLEELLGRLKDKDCSIFKGWLAEVVRTFLPGLEGMPWVIDANANGGVNGYKVAKTDKPKAWSGSNGGWAWDSPMASLR